MKFSFQPTGFKEVIRRSETRPIMRVEKINTREKVNNYYFKK